MTTIEGTVLNIIYKNPDNGYTVIDLDIEGELATAVGQMSYVTPGEFVRLSGAWAEHKSFGRQFKVSMVETSRPTSPESIKMYLASGLFHGVGEVTAGRIVDMFGANTLSVIENQPELLTRVKGVSMSLAQKISESLKEHLGVQDIVLRLQDLGLSAKQALKVYEVYGNAAAAAVEENPYCLIDEVTGIGFERADMIAARMGFQKHSPFRMENGIKHVLKMGMLSGHTCLPLGYLTKESARILDVPADNVSQALQKLAVNGGVVLKEYSGKPMVFLLPCYLAEADIARRLYLLSASKPTIPIKNPELSYSRAPSSVPLSEEQERAVYSALTHNVSIITGGPGTGKTTILNKLLNIFEQSGIGTVLCAPTGRAAKRMQSVSGHDAKTIHRLLEYGNPLEEEEEACFLRNEDNPLEAEAVIVDEASMMDVFLFRALLRALRDGTRLVVVGDADQLPSVGPGNVLSDMIASSCIPVTRLTHFYRQEGGGNIVANAHAVNRGEMPTLYETGDFVFLERDRPEQVLETLLALIKRMNGDEYGVQVISPIKKTLLGVHQLNQEIRELKNPRRVSVPELTYGAVTFRQGDKVMQIKNNYTKEWRLVTAGHYSAGNGVFNGEIGQITRIDPQERTLCILFDGEREAMYDQPELEQIEHAYAITVHKAQGSEFDTVFIPLSYSYGKFFTRNLFYTALTRARKKVVLIGSKACIRSMVQNVDTRRRATVLKLELQEFFQLFSGGQ